jgi:hypothetical protein
VELYLQSPNTLSWRGAQLGGAQGQLYYFAILKKYGKFQLFGKNRNNEKLYEGRNGNLKLGLTSRLYV